jgi:hypothetical protein
MASLQRTNQPGDMVTSRQIRGAILPWEKQLIDTLGLTIEEYNWYANEVANYRPERDPAYDVVPDVQCVPVVPLVMTVVGMGISFAASAMAPKPKLPRQTDPAQQQQQQQQATPVSVTGASVNVENRFTNIDGFTSVQPLARLGESMQLVFANRRNNYGGVRVETKLLWSQLLSQGNGQELLGIFLANGGELASQPDFDGIGIGDSLLRGYQASKLAVYFRNGNLTNRISLADKKEGGLNPRNASDVFLAELRNSNNLKPIFSGVRIPSTMTVFGISEPLPSAQDFRLPFKRITGGKFETTGSAQERDKINRHFACRTGVRFVIGENPPADREKIDIEVALKDVIEFHIYGDNISENEYGDIGAQDIRGREDSIRESADNALVQGETYLVGGVETVCLGADSEELWNPRSHKIYRFEALQLGKVRLVHEGLIIHSPDYEGQTFRDQGNPKSINPNYGPSLCKLAIAHFTTSRKLDQVEIGIKSKVFKNFNGITNFASLPPEDVIQRIEQNGPYTAGTYSDYGLRYSFFRVEIKEKGALEWYRLEKGNGGVFCVRGKIPVDQFNFIRVAFPDKNKQYELRFRPIAGGAYLAYNWPAGNSVCVLDCRTGKAQDYVVSTPIGSFTVGFKGYIERLDRAAGTNKVMIRGASSQGAVKNFTPITCRINSIISEPLSFTTTTNGSGTGLVVSAVTNKLFPASPASTVVSGMQAKWLHMGIMGAPIPSYDGQEYTKVVRFTKDRHYVDVQFTLRARTFAGYAQDVGGNGYQGTGYGTIDNNEGWTHPLLWRNLNRFPSEAAITVIAFDGFDVNDDGQPYLAADASGVYSVSMPGGFATPINGIVESKINVTYIEEQVYEGTINIESEGSNYKIGDKITINNFLNLPQLTITSVASSAESVFEEWDAVSDIYLNTGQSGSHENGPEHQIVYINEQRENIKLDKQRDSTNTIDYAPTYKDMTLLGLQLRNGREWSSFNNFNYYAKKGCKIRKIINDANGNTYDVNSTAISDASNLYPEILYHLVATSNLMPTTMIDWDGFAEGCKVCLANNFYWDGVLSAPVNIRDWGHENAQYFFLDFMVLGGKLSLQPTFPVVKGSSLSGYTLGGAYDRKPVISALFTDGNIIEDSLSVNWYPAEQRKAPQILVTMRDEVENGFAETRNILVKRNDPGNPNPQVEAVDFTGFCTSADHAIQFAKLLINMRYHITHVISFKTLPNGLALQPGQYFRVSSQARHVEQFQNGYVLQDGTVVSSSPMTAGTYTVYFWRSSMTQVEERSMVIGATGKTTPEFANSVFTQYSSSTSNRLYKAEMIAYDEEGMVEITGSHVPLETDGRITYLNMNATLFEVQNEQ